MTKMMKLNIQLFASASKSGSVPNSTIGNTATLSVSFDEGTPNTANNTTSVTVKGSLYLSTGSFSSISGVSLKLYWHDNRENKDVLLVTKNVTTMAKRATVSTSHTFDVTHLDDGTLSGYAKATWQNDSSSTYVPKTGSVQTANTVLTVVPRATPCPNISAVIARDYTIQLAPASNSFTHNLYWSFGTQNGNITINGNTPVVWKPVDTLHNQISGPSGTGTLTLTTYNNGTSIGTSTGTLTLSANPDTASPTITGTVKDTNAKTIALTGSDTKIVKGLSTVQISTTTTTKYSAGVKARYVNGTAFTGTSTTIQNATSSTYTIKVTDNRNLSSPDTVIGSASNLINYVPLTLNATFERNQPTDGKVNLRYSGSYFKGSIGNTTNTLTLQYKTSSESTWHSLTPTINDDNTYSGSLQLPGTYDYREAFTFQIKASDAYYKDANNNAIVVSQGITAGVPTYWWDKTSFTVEGDFYLGETKLLDMLHPVGEVYLTTNANFNPNTAFGGTWSQITGQDYLRIVTSNAGTTGGSNTITVANLPAHNHTGSTNTTGDHKHSIGGQNASLASGSSYARPRGYSSGVLEATYDTNTTGNHSHTFTTDNTGSGTAFYPKYYGCYAWRRTA